MDRRNFLKGLGTLVGGIAIDKAIPFNRVWSFPTVIKIVQKTEPLDYYVSHWLTSPTAWYLDNKPRYIIVHPQMLETAKKILNL